MLHTLNPLIHRSQRTKLEATAHHEAGHAVIGWRNEIPLYQASIVPKVDSHGHVVHANPLYRRRLDFNCSDNARLRAERAVRCALAGPIAQRMWRRSSYRHWHGQSDHAQAWNLLLYITCSEREAQAYWKLLTVQVEESLKLAWDAVISVAEALMEKRTLTRTEIEAAIQSSNPRLHL